MKRLYLPLVGLLVLAAFVVAESRAQAQTPPLCSSDLYLATGPPTLDVTATPATIDASSGTSLIEARPLNVLGDPPQAGCQVDLSTTLGSFVSTGGSTASVLTDAQGVASDSFQCDGVLGTATITALIALVLPNNIGPTMTATTQVECTESGVPDLSMEKSHDPDPFVFGGQGEFTLTVTNNGPGTATGTIVIDDIFIAGLTVVSDSNADWVCTGGPMVNCVYSGPPLAEGQSSSVTITVEVGAEGEVPEQFENCATVSTLVSQAGGAGPVADADPSNDQACDLVTVVTASDVPDLSIAKRHGSLDIFVQDDTGVDYIELTVGQTVFLAGQQDAFDQSDGPEPSSPSPALLLALTQKCFFGPLLQFDVVPDNLCFGHTLTDLPTIGAATLEIRLRANATDPLTDTDALALQLSADGTTFAWSLSLNTLIEWATGQQTWTPGSDHTFILDLAALPLDASGSTTTSILSAINNWAFGGQGQFALTVTNNGPGPASGFSISDSLPPGFTFVSDSGGDWTCSATIGQDVTCNYLGAPLAEGESSTVILTVAVGNPSDFTGGPVLHPVSIDVDNCATVQQLSAAGTAIADPDPSNDTVCDRIVMEGAPGAQPNVLPAPGTAGGFVVGVSGATDLQALADAQPFEVALIAVFDNSTGRFLTWINGAPAFANTLKTLRASDFVFIRAAE